MAPLSCDGNDQLEEPAFQAPGAPAMVTVESGGVPGSLPERLVMRSLAERYVSGLLHQCRGAADEALQAYQCCGADEEVFQQKGDVCTSKGWEDDSFVAEDLDEDGLSELLDTVACCANLAPRARRRPPPREAPLPASWATPSPPTSLYPHLERAPQPWGDPRDSESSRLQRLLAYSRGGPASQPAPFCHHTVRRHSSCGLSQPCSKPSRPCSAPSRPSSARTSRYGPSVATSCAAGQRQGATVSSTSHEVAKGVSPPKVKGAQRTPPRPCGAGADGLVPPPPKVGRSNLQAQKDKKKQPNQSKSSQGDVRRMFRRRGAVKWRNQDMMGTLTGARDRAHVSRAVAASLDSFGMVQKINASGDDLKDDSLEEAMRPPSTITSSAEQGGDNARLELKQSFGTLFHQAREFEQADQADRQNAVVMHTLHQLATATNLSLNDVLAGRRAFQAQDVEHRGTIDFSCFVEAVLNLQKEIHGTCANSAEVRQLCAQTWKEGETGMDLLQFLSWFSNNGFSDVMLLSEEARWLCRLSKQYQISRVEIENIKRHFDTFDADKNGTIDMDEFTKIMKRILKIPNDLDVPQARFRHYWSQIDTDCSGMVEFQEFLPWWINHFVKINPKGRAAVSKPFEDFYKMVRTLKRPDPPAHRNVKKR